MPGLSPRRLTIAVGLVMLGGSLLLAVLTASGVLPLITAALLAGVGALFAVLLVVIIGIRRVDAKVQKVLREHREHRRQASVSTSAATRPLTDLAGRADTVLDELRDLVKDLTGALGEDRVETVTALAEAQRHIDRGLADLSAAMLAPVGELDTTVRRLADAVEPLPDHVQRVGTQVGVVDRAVTRLPERLAKSVNASARQSYEQVEAYVDLRQLIRPRAPLPALSGWAAGPDVLRVVFEALWRGLPELIVECGSGSSSVWLGYAVEQLGAGRVVALEHDERYLAISRDLVRAHRLDEVVEIRHAPLEPWRPDDRGVVDEGGVLDERNAVDESNAVNEGGVLDDSGGADERDYAWYSTSQLADLTGIGALFVDGPPGATGPLARYPALPLLLSRCADDVVIVLDDAHRPDERELSDRWLGDYPELERSARGERTHVFTRRSS